MGPDRPHLRRRGTTFSPVLQLPAIPMPSGAEVTGYNHEVLDRVRIAAYQLAEGCAELMEGYRLPF